MSYTIKIHWTCGKCGEETITDAEREGQHNRIYFSGRVPQGWVGLIIDEEYLDLCSSCKDKYGELLKYRK